MRMRSTIDGAHFSGTGKATSRNNQYRSSRGSQEEECWAYATREVVEIRLKPIKPTWPSSENERVVELLQLCNHYVHCLAVIN